ncbi:membrane protein insertase YidC [Aestuariibacter sp. AA17]|uniref:Membrane protein insertase YidC n=1 Tax=Fluctibacter corallii TaxID=2984329 RepID=A0ABT3AD13_9ALTE|nr:membrane protein insertase YidC [Aestuariibacter sp. AA17]MCV2886540.1 membrane protein insertase YidC [Aestuariibacter sp. AA17]
MESQRSFLVIGLVMVSFLLWMEWQKDYGPQPVATVQTQPTQVNDAPAGQPSADVPVSEQSLSATSVTTGKQQIINVVSSNHQVQIDTRGGDIVSAKLLNFPLTQNSDEAFELLHAGESELYVAQSGLIGVDGPDANPRGRPIYQSAESSYEMTGDELIVPLTWKSEDGLLITKQFIFSRDQHAINVKYLITNQSDSAKQLQPYGQLKQTLSVPEGNMFMPTYRGTAYSTEDTRYEKYTFDDIEDENLRTTTNGGWVAMLEHYFVSAWIPNQTNTNNLFTRTIQNRFAAIGYTGEVVVLQPGDTTSLDSTLYLGPKDQDVLANLARGLDLTVDYGILWWISQPLFALLKFLHGLVGNWGLAIILITIIVKGAMYPLTKKQYESMAKLRNLAPKMQQLKDRFGDDRQKMSQGMMELYKKEKVNPMGGCFPLLLQMPIFLALYWVFLESVELRHADFYLWITDLSVKDPYFVLPVLTGASMYLLQKLQPMTVTDPMQQKIMQWMPVFMSIFFLWFPAGLVLYWLISNVITLIQAKMIYSSMEKRGLKTS